MRKEKRWRYFCDFCKKSGGNKYYMERHENSCTMNPNRVCSMCNYTDGNPRALPDMVRLIKDSVQPRYDEWPPGEWIEFREGITENIVIEKLRELSDCPACILAAIRQSGVPFFFDSFDYKKEREQLWIDHNDAMAEERDYGRSYY